MYKPFLAAALLLLSATAFSQTLFTYGGDTVTVPQFLAAYQKNNTGSRSKEALRNYLDLYIASKLKIKEAKARGYDTLPQIVSDLASLRDQIAPSYLKDEAAVNKLVDEARMRAAKDIHLQHIFISFDRNGVLDSVAAKQRAHEVLKKLESGQEFTVLAKEFSDDPSAKQNGGDAGFITVFTLPYAIESVIYNTPAGSIAPLYQSKKGYHIFKNAGERPAVGSIKIAQILLAFPPEADAAAKAHAKKTADSLYTALLKGANFGKLAEQFSNDPVSSQAQGQVPTFGVGEYDATFEKTVFALPKDGALSKPFLTDNGYHIVKRLQRIPAGTNKNDPQAVQSIRQKVEASDRMAAVQEALAKKVLQQARFQKQPFNQADLWAYSDSVLDGKPLGTIKPFADTAVLFTVGDKSATVGDWIVHAQTFRFKNDGTGTKPYAQLWDEFVQATALNYYQDHLEQYNNAFREQLEEFKDGNLFFEIMQREVWNKAQDDTAALQTFYNTHAQRYKWNKSADAIVFYATDAATAKVVRAQLLKKPSAWKSVVSKFSEKVTADSARFELSQLPNAAKQSLQKGTITQPEINTTDNTASFALILKLYNTPEQRSFAEAKGLVINDYQAELEKNWIASLKQKYPVVVNEKELAKL
jgi:peptidyl-prolyl cis-trans isomerase SurA